MKLQLASYSARGSILKRDPRNNIFLAFD